MCWVFVGLIATVVLTIALPGLWDAALICTLPIVGLALVGSWNQDSTKQINSERVPSSANNGKKVESAVELQADRLKG